MGFHLETPTLTKVAIFWITYACVWTVLLMAGMWYMIVHRNTPLVRIRGLWISFLALTLLHIYWVSIEVTIIFGPVAPYPIEYWVMGIYYPFGIALFHASNSRFLHVAKAQEKYAHHGSSVVKTSPETARSGGIWNRFRSLSYSAKILVVVGFGMFLQLIVTALMFIISRKYHSTWGIPGTELVSSTDKQQRAEVSRGWEWWPQVVWQLIWAWIVAPLHATPMWLVALNVPAMQPVNKYFVPPQWIGISIQIMEIFTVFLPCWEIMRSQTLRKETLDSIAHWEAKNKTSGLAGARSLHSTSTAVESVMSGWKSTNESVTTSNSGESILTMSALEHVLERNPGPLLEFSALRDFSGENIAFLTNVAEWRNSLPPGARRGFSSDSHTKELVHERFNSALRIYVGFISVRHAEFPINISSQDLKKLEAVFESSARVLYGEKREHDPVTPFDRPVSSPRSPATGTSWDGSEKMTVDGSPAGDRVQFWGNVPESFDEKVFDSAEKSIKYLVLTNTWPKFVRSRRMSMDSFDTEIGCDVLNVVRERHVPAPC